VNTPMARVSFRRCSRDVRSRAAAAGGGGFALAAAAAADEDDVGGRAASDLGAPAARAAPGSFFWGGVAGFGFVEVIPLELVPLPADGDRLGVELALPEPGVVLDPDRSDGTGEGVCADDGAVAPLLAPPASDPCSGADAGELD
jgi:hypothetical protein